MRRAYQCPTSGDGSGNPTGVDPRGGDVGGRIRGSGVNRGHVSEAVFSELDPKRQLVR